MYINRELSWLSFNRRVLGQAQDEQNPLFERLKFVSIFMSNLDEFFMVRVGSLLDQSLVSGIILDNKTGMSAQQQMQAIFEYTRALTSQKDMVFGDINTQLSGALRYVNAEEFSESDMAVIKKYFKNKIEPFIWPMIIDHSYPFPFFQNKELYIGAHLMKSHSFKLGVIPISQMFKKIVWLSEDRYCLIEDVLYYYCDAIFKKHEIVGKAVFKITRNADIEVQQGLFDEDVDYRQAMQQLLKIRKKLSAVRLDLWGSPSEELHKYMCKKLNLAEQQIFESKIPLELSFVKELEAMLKPKHPQLFYAPLPPKAAKSVISGEPILPQALKKDILLCYPFESIGSTIDLLNEAAVDENVISIKITLYRVAKRSKIISALIRAREKGKYVYVVIELRARFDEQHNIEQTKALEEAGVIVCYGMNDYKTHCKVALITRKTPTGVEYITQIGTGNYNEQTATQYTDMSLITSNQDIGYDAAQLFQAFSLGETLKQPTSLLVAPSKFRSEILRMIDEQIMYAKKGQSASVLFKVNSLTDKYVIDKIAQAAQSGVKITLIVRGMCCIKASENITILSIVGRYLEHSRIYSFGQGECQQLFISSGDLMTRSAQRRIEVAVPIYEQAVKRRINSMLEIMLQDNTKARYMQEDGSYIAPQIVGEPLDSQMHTHLYL